MNTPSNKNIALSEKRAVFSDNRIKSESQHDYSINSAGDRISAMMSGKGVAWLSKKSGVPQTTVYDAIKKGPARTDVARKIADALEVSLDWLITGRSQSTINNHILADAENSDWVDVNEFDLAQFTENGKGPPVNRTPFRKDWLHQSLGISKNIWITRLPAQYIPLGLEEGINVFVTDIRSEELTEGNLCIFRINNGFIIARASFYKSGNQMAAGSRIGEFFVSTKDIGYSNDQFELIARILGEPIKRIG